MGRPSLTETRTAEILDAFERCVARYGIEGSSLERIAEEAGMKRSILRHYVGNRDELVHALAQRVVAKYRDELDQQFARFDSADPVDDLLGFLFPSKTRESAESVMVVEALIAAGDQYPEVKKLMLGYVEDLVSACGRLLRQAYPQASRQQCWSVAYGVVSICFNQESLTQLDLPSKYLRAAKSCASALVDSLQSGR